jgi:large subunit ribosomal protein L14e
MFEIGRICMKTAGREAGRFCVIVAKEKEKGFVLITGPKAATHVRRRKCNLEHLEPTPFRLEIKENATDEQVLELYDKERLYERLRIIKPGAAPEEPEHREEREREHKARREERAEKKEERQEAKHEEHKEAKETHAKKHEEAKEHKAKHKKEAKAEKPKKARAKKPAAKKAKKE